MFGLQSLANRRAAESQSLQGSACSSAVIRDW